MTSTQWVYQINNGGTVGLWRVQVVNSDSQSSTAYNFTVVAAQTLTASLSANVTTGNAPLNVTVTAGAGGTATGTINYTFYCNRSDTGTNITSPWDAKFNGVTNSSQGSTCSYATAGSYTVKVIVEQGSAPAAEARVAITVSAAQTLTASLSANVSNGNAPLNVTVTAGASGTATGTINYTFYCNRSDTGTNITSPWDAKFNGVTNTSQGSTCSYATAGSYTVKVIVERGSAPAAEARVTITVSAAQTLTASLSANVTTGSAPLNVTVTAGASGTATGTINYTFYCNRSDTGTNITSPWDAKFNGVTNTSQGSTCSYATAGSYTVKVIVERGSAPAAEARVTITVSAAQTLTASLSANVTTGNAPLNVTVTAGASGTATGTINYTFYCNRSDTGTNITSPWDAKFNGVTNTSQGSTCSYATAGSYTVKVIVERGSAPAAEARVTITVSAAQTLTASLSANVTTGNAPLNVTVTAGAGGTATGTINYTFYCNRSDTGTNITSPWDAKFNGVTNTSQGSTCSYATAGSYTVKVIVEQGSAPAAEARVTITVSAAQTLTASLSANVTNGNAPLNVTVTAGAGGTATGTINYTFYCNRSDTGTNITSPWDAKFNGVTNSSQGSTCSYATAGSYTVKVIVEQGSAPAAEARVTITVAAGALTAPSLINPSSAAVAVSTTPSFSWTPSMGANKYWLTVATTQAALPSNIHSTTCPGTCVISINLTGNNYMPAAALVSNMTYYWEVQGYLDTVSPTQQGPFSQAGSFTTAQASTGADPGATSSLTLVSGTLNGQTVSPSSRTVTVQSGNSLVGSFVVQVNSTFASNAALAMGVTPNWAAHSTSFKDLGSFATPVTGLLRTINVNVTVPTTPGTYYLIAAFGNQTSAAQVMSSTDSSYGTAVWGNGDDVADWSPTAISIANSSGTVRTNYLFQGGIYFLWVPATALEVVVTAPAPTLIAPATPLTFQYQQGVAGSLPGKSLQVDSSIPGTIVYVSVATTDGGNWLNLSANTLTLPSSLNVTVAPGLTAGNYSGSVTLTAAGMAPVTIPVNHTVSTVAFSPDVFACQSGQLDYTSLISDLPTIVLTHGLQHSGFDVSTLWTGSSQGQARKLIQDALSSAGIPANVVQFIWKDAGQSVGLFPFIWEYDAAKNCTHDAGLVLSKLLSDSLGTSYSQPIHFIGHSLGTVVNTYAAADFLQKGNQRQLCSSDGPGPTGPHLSNSLYHRATR